MLCSAHPMCGLTEWLWYWSAEARANRARGTVHGALTRLRSSQREIDGNIRAKQRRIHDVDRNIMEIGLRWRAARPATDKERTRLPDQERSALKNELRRKRLYCLRIQRFYGLLATVEEQIGLLEDAGTLSSSIAAIRTGATAHDGLQTAGGLRPKDVEDILERVSEQQALAADTQQYMLDQQAVTEAMQGINDADLEDELASLMNNDEFTQQFDAQDVARAQMDLADAPDAPLNAPTQPTTHYSVVLPNTL